MSSYSLFILVGAVSTIVLGVFNYPGLYGDRRINPMLSSRYLYQDPPFDPNNEIMLDDMIIPYDLHASLYKHRRNGVIDRSHIWPNKTVPYYISPEFSGEHRNIIRQGLLMIESNTCVRFIEIQNPLGHVGPYAHVVSKNGCYAKIGSQCNNNVCDVSLAIQGCLRPGIVAHEFLHVLGFFHMQCSAGRGKFIQIQWDNIDENLHGNFIEYKDDTTLLGTPYDYDSITHYGRLFFSTNGRPTILTADLRYQNQIGQREFLSAGDIERINRLYECQPLGFS